MRYSPVCDLHTERTHVDPRLEHARELQVPSHYTNGKSRCHGSNDQIIDGRRDDVSALQL